jgi:glutamyl-tRNA synthetase
MFSELEDFSEDSIEQSFKSYLHDNELGFGKVGPGFRLAVTGKGMGPSMFAICSILGKDETLGRMDLALEKLP